MHVPQHLEVSGFGPEVAGFDGGGDGCGEVASRGLPSEGDEHPARRFVDGDGRPILEEDRYTAELPAFAEFDD